MKELSKREREIVNLKAEGLGNKQIAHKLGISECTIYTYLDRIKRKFKSSSTIEVLLTLQKLGLITTGVNTDV